MDEPKLTIKTSKGEELTVGYLAFPMFDEKIVGAYAQYTYDAPGGGRPLVGSLLKDDIYSVSAAKPDASPETVLGRMQKDLEFLINSEPTGELRNKLCDMNIQLLSLKLTKKFTEKA